MVVGPWWWSVAGVRAGGCVVNMIIFYIRDRKMFFVFVVLVWVLLGLMGDEWFWDGRGWGWRIEGAEGLDLGLRLRDWDLRG